MCPSRRGGAKAADGRECRPAVARKRSEKGASLRASGGAGWRGRTQKRLTILTGRCAGTAQPCDAARNSGRTAALLRQLDLDQLQRLEILADFSRARRSICWTSAGARRCRPCSAAAPSPGCRAASRCGCGRRDRPASCRSSCSGTRCPPAPARSRRPPGRHRGTTNIPCCRCPRHAWPARRCRRRR